MRLEVVITYWEDGLFKSRDRIESNTPEKMREQFNVIMDIMEHRIIEYHGRKYAIADDDDIPF